MAERTTNLDELDYWARDDRMAEADERRAATERFVPCAGPLPCLACTRCGSTASQSGLWYRAGDGVECWACAHT